MANNTPPMEESVTVHTTFKIANVNPLDDLKVAFIQEYQNDPETLIRAGLMEA